jgi:hypothetical protein
MIHKMTEVAYVTFTEPPGNKNGSINISPLPQEGHVGLLAPTMGDTSVFRIVGGGAFAFVKPVYAHSLRSAVVKQQHPYSTTTNDKASQTGESGIQSSTTTANCSMLKTSLRH